MQVRPFLNAGRYTYLAIAAELDISDMTIRRWCTDAT
jgi:hypothetical protein